MAPVSQGPTLATSSARTSPKRRPTTTGKRDEPKPNCGAEPRPGPGLSREATAGESWVPVWPPSEPWEALTAWPLAAATFRWPGVKPLPCYVWRRGDEASTPEGCVCVGGGRAEVSPDTRSPQGGPVALGEGGGHLPGPAQHQERTPRCTASRASTRALSWAAQEAPERATPFAPRGPPLRQQHPLADAGGCWEGFVSF